VEKKVSLPKLHGNTATMLVHHEQTERLLIERPLADSPCRFTELASRLPGISTNLLTERPRQLLAFEIVEYDTGSLPQFVITHRL